MTDFKSIRELVASNGNKPVWVKDSDEDRETVFFVVGIAPDGWAIGWNECGEVEQFKADREIWELARDPYFVPSEVVE